MLVKLVLFLDTVQLIIRKLKRRQLLVWRKKRFQLRISQFFFQIWDTPVPQDRTVLDAIYKEANIIFLVYTKESSTFIEVRISGIREWLRKQGINQ